MQKSQAKEVRGGLYGVESTAPLVVGKPLLKLIFELALYLAFTWTLDMKGGKWVQPTLYL